MFFQIGLFPTHAMVFQLDDLVLELFMTTPFPEGFIVNIRCGVLDRVVCFDERYDFGSDRF